jgi:hypothetical protein
VLGECYSLLGGIIRRTHDLGGKIAEVLINAIGFPMVHATEISVADEGALATSGLSAQSISAAAATNQEMRMDQNARLIFFAVLTITLLCGVAATTLVLIGSNPLPPAQQTIVDSMLQGFQVGTGTVFGLLGGRSLSDRS